jgi:peptidoglycan hydrolase-like protein with peptidoglycan-binding domain
MSKNKIKKEIRQSERKKYLRTMMADLGITSLDDLPSDRARKDLLEAVKPRPNVEKRLKEMGYDFSGGKNKRSLGKLNIKVATSSPDVGKSIQSAIAIRHIIGTLPYRRLLKDLYPQKWSREHTFDTYRSSIEKSIDPKIYLDNKAEIDRHLQIIFDFFFEASKTISSDKEIADLLLGGKVSISRGHEYPGDIKIIQEKLEAAGFLASGYEPGVFSDDTEAAVRRFQIAAGLSETGSVDYSTFVSLGRFDIRPGSASSASAPATQPAASAPAPATQPAASAPAPATQPAASASPPASSGNSKRDLSFIHFRNRGGISGASPAAKEFLYVLNDLAKKEGKRVTVTSLYRGPYDQARVMLNNYNSRGAGSNRANSYLKRLYRRYPRINDIVNIFAGSVSRKEKIQMASRVIKQSWPKVGHLVGESIDMIPRDDKVQSLLEGAQAFANVKILKETDHFHLTVRPGAPGGGAVRSFNS